MKKQLLSLAALVLTASAFGQVENDDMYFNSKDRAALKAQKASEESAYTTMASAKKTKKAEQATPAEEVINPTDSYSARNVNPEFAARSNSQTAAADNEDYFVNNYQYNKAAEINNWNSNFGGMYNNPWYGNNYYQPSIYGWNSPYYGSAYDPYGNPWCNPYYQSGWSSSFSYHWGNSWNYGWGSGIGMGMSYAYGNPYAYNPWGYSSFGYGYGGYGYGSYYPSNVIVVNNNNYYGENGRKVVYGKRGSHGGMVTSPQDPYVAPTRTTYPSSIRQTATGGRVAATSGRQEDYYNRSWRNSQQTQSYPSRGSSNDSWDRWNSNNSNNSWSNGSSRDTNSFSPSNSGGSGGATRQSAPSGSGTSGRTRGRD